MIRFLKGFTAQLEMPFSDVLTGLPLDPDGGAAATVPVTIYDGAGEAFDTIAAATRVSQGLFRITLSPADYLKLDTYRAKWEPVFGGITQEAWSDFELVGEFYFSVAEARAAEGGKLADTTKFPTQAIIDEREDIESQFEDNLGYAAVPRGKRETLTGDGDTLLLLEETRIRQVYSVSVTDSSGTVTTYDSTDLADIILTSHGGLERRTRGTFSYGYRVSIHYVHGEQSLPGGLKRAALKVLKDRLMDSNISDRARSFTNESGTLEYSTANGLQRPFGIPEVDALLWKLADHRVGIA